jgi:hypothetical protein
MVSEDQTGKTLSSEPFSFTPAIKGRTYWKDRWTLALKPEGELRLLEEYTVFLILRSFSRSIQPLSLNDFAQLCRSGRDVMDFYVNSALVDQNDPSRVRLEGAMIFNIATDQNVVEKAINVDLNGQPLKVSVKKEPGDNFYSFVSEAIKRGETTNKLNFSLNRKIIEMPVSINKTLEIPPLSDFTADDAVVKTEQRTNSVLISLSDEIDTKFDVSRYIDIDPPVGNFKIWSVNKLLVARGDFRFGQSYKVNLKSGLKSRWGTKTKQNYTFDIKVPDMEPFMEFTHSGIFLPSSNKEKITFRSGNVNMVNVTVKKIFSNNITFFMHDYQLQGSKTEQKKIWSLERIGSIVASETITINPKVNEETVPSLIFRSFSNLPKGIYILELSTDKDGIMYQFPESMDRWSYSYYIDSRVFASKTIICSDIGMTVKNRWRYHDGIYNRVHNCQTAFRCSCFGC